MHDDLGSPLLVRQSAAVLRLGALLLSAGAGSYRVKDSMRRVAEAVGLREHRAQVTLTEITTTARDEEHFRTEVIEQRAIGVNADRLDRIAEYVDGLRPGTAVADVEAEVDRIGQRPLLYGPAVNALAVALACAAFAFLNGGGVVVCAAVLAAAGLGQLVRRRMQHARLNQFAVTALAAALASAVYVGVVLGLERLGYADPAHEAGFISAVLFLVPGFPLVTAVLDLVRMDFSAGIARAAYATLILLSAGMSVWAVSLFGALELELETGSAAGGALGVALRMLASAVAAAGFAILFNSPLRVAAIAAVIGALANPGRLLLLDAGMAPQAAAGLAALAIGLLAAVASTRAHFSRVTLSVPAVVIMVPGVSVYRSLVHLNEGEIAEALNSGVEATFVIMALGVGLAMARILTDRNWAFDR
nr:threonine/serine exporter family protein [Georgenia faecalis]